MMFLSTRLLKTYFINVRGGKFVREELCQRAEVNRASSASLAMGIWNWKKKASAVKTI
jgi:hypothetical protein